MDYEKAWKGLKEVFAERGRHGNNIQRMVAKALLQEMQNLEDAQIGPRICPIFEKEGNEFVICTNDFIGSDTEQAMNIGRGTSLVEAVLWRCTFTGRVIDVTEGVKHITAKLGNVPVAIIKGPLFDDVARSEAS